MKHSLDKILHAQEKAKKLCIDEACIDWQKQKFMDTSFQKFPLDFRSKEGRLFRKKCSSISNTLHLKTFTNLLSKLPVIEPKEVIDLRHCPTTVLHTIYKYCLKWWTTHTIVQKGRGYFMSFMWRNDVDPISQDNVCDIPKPYMFTYIDAQNHVYVFDIRTLHAMFQSNMYKNPFNKKAFESCIVKAVNHRIQRLQSLHYSVAMDDMKTQQPTLSIKKKNEQNTLKVLQALDHMGYHVTMDMFQKLTNAQHVKWYLRCEDIFNYRAELTPQAKANIVPNGNVFPLKASIKSYMSRKHLLIKHVLDTMIKLTTNGVTESDRVTGAMYTISAWTECSDTFRTSFPMLYQPP